MQAVILAAGLGKRLRPITETLPKPLVPINGKAVIEYTLANLPSAITEIIFVVGHKGHMIKDKFGNSYQNRKIFYAEQNQPLGTGHAVKCAAPLIKESFLLLFGDDVYGPKGLEKIIKKETALLVKKVEDPSRFGVIALDKAGFVEKIIEKPKDFVSDLTWTGAGFFKSDILKIETPLSPRGEYEFTDMVNALIKNKVLIGTELADFWLPGNTPEEIKAAALILTQAYD